MDLRERKEFEARVPEIAAAVEKKPVGWINPRLVSMKELPKDLAVTVEDIDDAEARLERFAPYIMKQFPETEKDGGLIESPFVEIPKMKELLKERHGCELAGRLYLKEDSQLAIAGSIKARGGIYEILKYAETLAIENGLLKTTDDYSILASQEFVDFFGRYTIQVGSTGNLGLGIGIISAKLGFKVIVHMSHDARQWKKDLLRSKGVTVKEYESDYGEAVKQGRKESDSDPTSYFVDDENSRDLFMGYSVAPRRLKKQLEAAGVFVDQDHPLFVYLPCGIGGAPGGIAYGLKTVFGDNVHCFFTEPVDSCCMLFGMATGLHDQVCVQDFGISGKTHADGLAVGRPSAFVGKFMEPMLSGIFTTGDAVLYDYMRDLMEAEGVFIEPSSCAAFAFAEVPGRLGDYIKSQGLEEKQENITHIAWATGGRLVPEDVKEEYVHTHLA